MTNQIIGIQHVGLTVHNLDEAVRWFHDALGFYEIFREDPIEIQTEHWSRALDVPIGTKLEGVVLIGNGIGCEIELFQYNSPAARRERPRNFDNGGHHLALQVRDISSAAAELVKFGTEPLGGIKDNPDGPWEGADWIYMKTPFGLYIELIEMPKGGVGYERRTSRSIHRPTPNLRSESAD
jgi:catechol 2,3-dioxygenase-like lactoylglutathione lyase family enzyme